MSKVKEDDIEEVKFQVCLSEHKFDKLSFFKQLAKPYWIFFFDHMKVDHYKPGEVVYSKRDIATYFYVIKSGAVYFELGMT